MSVFTTHIHVATEAFRAEWPADRNTYIAAQILSAQMGKIGDRETERALDELIAAHRRALTLVLSRLDSITLTLPL